MCTKSHNHMMYGSWDMECERQNFCHYGPFFMLFYPYGSRKSKFSENKRKCWKIILHMFTVTDSKMIYGFSDMECNRQDFLSNWTVFCPFTPSQPKSKLWKTEKKPWRYQMLYCSLDMAHYGINCYFSFWAIFYSFTSLTA